MPASSPRPGSPLLRPEASARIDHVALAPGTRIGRYEIETVLGQGGFGITYCARDAQLDRVVAIKEYLPAGLAVRQDGTTVLPRSTEAAAAFDWGRRRFVEEGRTLASLHAVPSIVQVFDFIEENGTAYMIMALVQGETLEKRIADAGSLGPSEIDAILWPLLDGLQKVHEAGFLHRDIKPANVLLAGDGKPVLIDFGASRASLADRTATMTAIFTPGYAAPEQFSSARQGAPTDIYGLGATLYHAITGAPPPSAVDRLLQDDCVSLAHHSPNGFPRGLLAGIDAALSLHAEDRPQSIEQWRSLLRRDLEEVAQTVVIEAPEPATLAVPTKATRRGATWKWLALASGVAVVLAVGDYALSSTQAPVTSVEPAVEATTASMPQVPQGEAEEAALRLGMDDRRRVQRALTVLGFDTHGSDGAFGPRSREMIASWQRRRGQTATGFLTADQHRDLLREAKTLLNRVEGERKPGTTPTPPASGSFEASYGGSLTASATGGGQAALRPVEADVAIAGGYLTGRLNHPTCGALPVLLAVDASGTIGGSLRIPEAAGCSLTQATASGRVKGGALSLDIRGVDVTLRGTLSTRGGQETRVETREPAGLRSNLP
ncbi:MAG: serine/threonine-protein kinase [Reyranellaceae bacterium]